jgi:uncharacterized protein YhbP (UPF0306 family)
MEKPDIAFVRFLKKHHVLTLATSFENKPWCANCFYTYMEDENALVFTSDKHTRHATEAVQNPFVSGSVVLETMVVGKIQGIQFEGHMFEANGFDKYKMAYLKRFPFAVLSSTSIWVIDLSHMKLTDNRLGFGKKLIWKKDN